MKMITYHAYAVTNTFSSPVLGCVSRTRILQSLRLPQNDISICGRNDSLNGIAFNAQPEAPASADLAGLAWSDENVRTSGIYLPAGRSDGVAAAWGSFAIDRRAFFTNRITLSGPERPTLPEGE